MHEALGFPKSLLYTMLDINHPKQAINYLAVKIPGMNHSLSHTMFTQQFDLAKYPCLSCGLHIGYDTYEAISIVLIMIS